MRILKEKKAVSTLVLILLLLCAATIGALVSYWWVMGNFYLEPENITGLTITAANFPLEHADYFTFTVVNPSHSPSSTNVTSIYLTVGNQNITYPVTETSPDALPIKMDRASQRTILCFKDWGDFAGQNITIHVQTLDGSGATWTAKTDFVKVDLEVFFDPAASTKQFTGSILNEAESKTNLTITRIIVNDLTLPQENLSITLPQNLTNTNVPVSFIARYNWENIVTKIVEVETSEGYRATATSNATASVLLTVENVSFPENTTKEIGITVSNSPSSSTLVNINDVVLTYYNGTQFHIDGNLTTPKFYSFYSLLTNSTVTFNHCMWDWTNYRDKNLTVSIYTKQNFTVVSRTVPNTPPAVVFKIAPSFNLTDTNSFLVNVTNTAISLQEVAISHIKLNSTEATFTSDAIPIGQWRQITCSIDWSSFRGKIGAVSVNASNVIISQYIPIPSVNLQIFGYGNSTDKTRFSVTIISSNNSLITTLDKVVVTIANQTVFQTSDIGFSLQPGANMTLTFSWNWSSLDLTQAKITVVTTQGFEFSGTFTIT